MYVLFLEKTLPNGERQHSERAYYERSDALTVFRIEVSQLLQAGMEYNWFSSSAIRVVIDDATNDERHFLSVYDKDDTKTFIELPSGRL